jgi:para-aminobenzoate synthetase component I
VSRPAIARLGGQIATDLVELTDDLDALDGVGRWAVLLPFEGSPCLARFAHWVDAPAVDLARPWIGPEAWKTSMSGAEYVQAVRRVKGDIAAGRVYQVNVCRVLSTELAEPEAASMGGLHALLDRDHPAPFAGFLDIPDAGVQVATASPELFLRRSGRVIESAPIKGTATTEGDLWDKDRAENIMIVDLVRNDLSRVCEPGSVRVPELLAVHAHPGLVHLVSTVRGQLSPSASWRDILAATFPPGSVTGAPKHTALQVIAESEGASRGPYCGAIGWIDADTGEAELAVAIRTFWMSGSLHQPTLHFGTGAGITWGSDPEREWAETELKAHRLLSVAKGVWP